MTETLKPCPWCQGDGYIVRSGSIYYVECRSRDCGIGPDRPTEAEAITAWNSRPQPAPQAATADVVAEIREQIRSKSAAHAKAFGERIIALIERLERDRDAYKALWTEACRSKNVTIERLSQEKANLNAVATETYARLRAERDEALASLSTAPVGEERKPGWPRTIPWAWLSA